MTSDPDATPPACTCPTPWPALTAVIEGSAYTVVPTPAHTPASALYLAHCTGCGAPYTHPWRRLNASARAA
ncbi:hypothetical protein OG800_50635 (plasmid) [Streptomyces sp. NBC_00445]|uniref:hypothetical protein n=1 Tax=Streptomyces sp. NBC_00445 TaxID=2975745 RepID=UPI002E21DDBE